MCKLLWPCICPFSLISMSWKSYRPHDIWQRVWGSVQMTHEVYTNPKEKASNPYFVLCILVIFIEQLSGKKESRCWKKKWQPIRFYSPGMFFLQHTRVILVSYIELQWASCVSHTSSETTSLLFFAQLRIYEHQCVMCRRKRVRFCFCQHKSHHV